MRVSAAATVTVFLALALGGCAIDPFVDGRREAGSNTRVGPSNPDRVAICYNRRGSSPEIILELARSECAKTGRTPQYLYQEHIQCSVLNPTRAYFQCVAEPAAGAS